MKKLDIDAGLSYRFYDVVYSYIYMITHLAYHCCMSGYFRG